jgi:hypothetical protein
MPRSRASRLPTGDSAASMLTGRTTGTALGLRHGRTRARRVTSRDEAESNPLTLLAAAMEPSASGLVAHGDLHWAPLSLPAVLCAAHSSSCPPCRSRSRRSRSAQKSAKSRRPATPPRPRDAALFQPPPPPPHPSSRAEPIPTLATVGAGFGAAWRGRGRFARARQHCKWCRRARRMSGGRSRRRAGAAWPRGRTEGGRWGHKGNSVNSLGV